MTHTVKELFDLTGRGALITGGAGYLGTAFSEALSEAGATVVLSSRTVERAERAVAALPTPDGQQHIPLEMDHKDEESLKTGFALAVEQAGRIDILVNNGTGGATDDLTTVSGEQFIDQMANVVGYFLLARIFRDHVIARQASGSIVNLGSMYGVVGSYPDAYEGLVSASPVSYHALKGGIVHMTRHLAAYWARDNIRVNCLSPGPFPNFGKVPAEMVERLCGKSPMGRMGLPYELKGTLLLLASDAGSYITGQNILIDGGWTTW